MRGYHFVGDTLRDGSPIPADGEPLVFAGVLVLCESGLHFSECPFDALQYAPGNTLCLVECEGVDAEQSHDDKHVCRQRTIVQRIDATELLREAARHFASEVLYLWDAPYVVKEYLATGDESIRAAAGAAAWAAAGPTAWAAAGAAAWDAARDDAWAAARDAAWDAARAAAGAAAGAAAWDAARAAAWDAQRKYFRELVNRSLPTPPQESSQ